jgi:hypothetical protein
MALPEVKDAILLRSPDGGIWKIAVNNDGMQVVERVDSSLSSSMRNG